MREIKFRAWHKSGERWLTMKEYHIDPYGKALVDVATGFPVWDIDIKLRRLYTCLYK